MKSIAYVGMDVHKDTISVCILVEGHSIPLDWARLETDHGKLVGYLKKYTVTYELRCCYEASSSGYTVYNWLAKADIACAVIAPSLIPKRSGRRVKTDRIDALKLASLYRAGELTAIRVPSAEEEKARRLVRMHDQLTKDRSTTKNYMNQFLRQFGYVYRDGHRWTQRHWEWLRGLSFEGTDAMLWAEYLVMLEFKSARLKEIDRAIIDLGATPRFAPDVKTLCCLRGFGVLTAMVILTEVVDFVRFSSADKLMSFFGLVPSESSSGGSTYQGSITKTGNTHCRRAVVEAAHKYVRKPRVGRDLAARHEGQPASVVAHSLLAQQRLHKKYWSIANRKAPQKAVVAVARELTGFIWALMTGHCAPKAAPTVAA